jgi:thymidylate kinase
VVTPVLLLANELAFRGDTVMESQSEFVTKTDLKLALDAAMQAQDQRFEGRMDVLEERLTNRFTTALRDTETKLLQAFYGFAEANNKRLVQ